jgi:hypothetical protein
MTGRAAAFVATLAALRSESARLRAGLPELDALLRDVVRAAVPANPQFERERSIVQAHCPRELVLPLGFLNEGENEAELLLELIDSTAAAHPDEPVAHMIDEACYLRTSIDPQWQLDDGEPSAGAALAYLFAVLDKRLDRLREATPRQLRVRTKGPNAPDSCARCGPSLLARHDRRGLGGHEIRIVRFGIVRFEIVRFEIVPHVRSLTQFTIENEIDHKPFELRVFVA